MCMCVWREREREVRQGGDRVVVWALIENEKRTPKKESCRVSGAGLRVDGRYLHSGRGGMAWGAGLCSLR